MDSPNEGDWNRSVSKIPEYLIKFKPSSNAAFMYVWAYTTPVCFELLNQRYMLAL